MPAWIRDAIGVRVPLSESGTLIGRSMSCNIVVDDPEISRRHVLILHLEGRTQVLALGRIPPTLAGAVVESSRWAEDGDELVVGNARFVLELGEQAPPSTSWALEFAGRNQPIHRSPFTIGSGPANDLCIEGWPDGAATLFHAEGRLFVEVAPLLEVDGECRGEVLYPLEASSTLRYGSNEIRVVRTERRAGSTGPSKSAAVITLEFVPNGAVLRFTLPAERTAFLPNKRADLLAALLSPTNGQKAGEWISDEVLNERIWGSQGGSRAQLNTLIHRARVSLTEAGLDGSALVERAPGGGATRFAVTSDTKVTIG